jgi:peptide deformylase
LKYEVLTYGRPELRRKAAAVAKPDAALRQLARDLIDTMYRANGVGLAAQQIGRTEDICVIDIRPAFKKTPPPPELAALPMPLVMINPRLATAEGATTAEEGCLSFPEVYVSIRRAERVTVTFMTLDGATQTLAAAGFLARAIQHELDHLAGVLLIDHMSAVQKVAVAGKLKRIKQEAAEAAA